MILRATAGSDHELRDWCEVAEQNRQAQGPHASGEGVNDTRSEAAGYAAGAANNTVTMDSRGFIRRRVVAIRRP
jgi:hypothetical protein